MPSFEDEDERVAAQRVARRMRQAVTHASREFRGDPREIAAATRPPSRCLHDHAGTVLEEDDDGAEEENDAPEKMETLHRVRTRGTPSVSFSEPVETLPLGSMLQTPSPSSPSTRVARRGRNRLETRLAELQRDVANLSMRLRASGSTTSHTSASFHEDEPQAFGRERSTTATATAGVPRGPRQSLQTNGESRLNGGVGGSKSPARTILKKSAVASTTTTTMLETAPPRRSAGRTRSRSRGRGGEDNENEDDAMVATLENGHAQDDRPLRVRPSNGQQEPPKSAKEMLRVVRELRVVAVERDQLRYELDQTKRSLAALKKKYNEAVKWKDAYDKMKAHCDSLQESLDLSEKIRVRQKRLLQQLQQTVQHEETTKTKTRTAAPHRVDVLDSVLHDTSTATAAGPHTRRATTRRGDTGQAPLRSTMMRGNASKPSATAINTSTRSYNRSDFDSLLQIPLPERSIAGSTAYRRTTQTKREPSTARPTTTSRTPATRTKATPPVSSTSRSTKPASTTRSNHFLAPTQSSLSHIAKRRSEATRPPFVV